LAHNGGLTKLLKRRFPESEYHVSLFDELKYIRKLCPTCGEYFWTQNPDQTTCGESTSEGCAPLTFINNSPTSKSYNLPEMREAFLSFFERHGHERVKPYPVVARWRDDVYFTMASIADFQPYVTNGIIPPPANPLVISQPSIRFVDVDNVGPTFGRHLTLFEMGGHHAFNYPDKEVYWKDETVRYHHEFVTKELGVKSEEVVYKEDVWIGGGNAGPDLETIVRGLELATLVFMRYKIVDNEFVELPIRTVDTGYGIERFAWLSQGSVSCFHAICGSLLDEILRMAGLTKVNNELLARVVKHTGVLVLEKAADRREAREKVAKEVGISVDELTQALIPIESAFAVADHTKCLVFMLAEGVVPSNVRGGYLTRLMLRRTYRLLRTLAIEDKLSDIVDKQISLWSEDFPHLKEMRDEIHKMLSVEQDKFQQTLKKGSALAKKVATELKAKGISRIPTETLVQLYDSHGLPPEVVAETVEGEGVHAIVPENFYMMVAQQHIQAPPTQEVEPIKGLETKLSNVPPTRMLYYEDAYTTDFEARVLRVLEDKYVVLDQTAFYPEGGGQPADHGFLKFGGTQTEVVDAQKIGNVIVHVVKGWVPKEGERITGAIDWKRRSNLMRQHSATHVLMGAARRVLGEHVWQAGAQKGLEASRLDISHFQRLSKDEVRKIEELANEAVTRNIPIETSWKPRTEAEKTYGFRLYQGGVVPGKEIRVVKTPGWEVEACAGTHVKSTGEIGLIKILRTERIQDGVERFVFSAGTAALKAVQQSEELLDKISEKLNAPREKLEQTTDRVVTEWKETRREKERLIKEIAELSAEECLATAREMQELKIVTRAIKEVFDVDRLIQTASEIVKREPKSVVVLCGVNETARIVVMAGKEAVKRGANARQIADEAASLLGGGGSGITDFAQGGGTRVAKVSEALKKAEEVVKRQVEGKKRAR